MLAFETEDVLQAWALPMENIIGGGGFDLALATNPLTSDEHLKKQAPKVLKKYLKDIGEQRTYMQNDQRVVSKDDNKNKTKTKEQAAVKSNRGSILKHS